MHYLWRHPVVTFTFLFSISNCNDSFDFITLDIISSGEIPASIFSYICVLDDAYHSLLRVPHLWQKYGEKNYLG